MIYVVARELSISLTKIEFLSISALGSHCVRVTSYYITRLLLVLR